MKQPVDISVWHTIGYALFASFGGGMGYVLRTMDAEKKLSWPRLFAETLAAGFVGSIVMMVCNALELNPLWTGVIVGVSGWLGATASIRLLETIVYKRLGISHEDVAITKEVENVRDTDSGNHG